MYNVNSIHVLMKWFSFNISHHLLVHKNSATKTQVRGFKMNQMFYFLPIFGYCFSEPSSKICFLSRCSFSEFDCLQC